MDVLHPGFSHRKIVDYTYISALHDLLTDEMDILKIRSWASTYRFIESVVGSRDYVAHPIHFVHISHL